MQAVLGALQSKDHGRCGMFLIEERPWAFNTATVSPRRPVEPTRGMPLASESFSKSHYQMAGT